MLVSPFLLLSLWVGFEFPQACLLPFVLFLLIIYTRAATLKGRSELCESWICLACPTAIFYQQRLLQMPESFSGRPSVGVHQKQPCGPAIRLGTQTSGVLVYQPSFKIVPVQPCRHSHGLDMSPTSPRSCFPVLCTEHGLEEHPRGGYQAEQCRTQYWHVALWQNALGQGIQPQKGLSYVTIHLTPDVSCPGEL